MKGLGCQGLLSRSLGSLGAISVKRHSMSQACVHISMKQLLSIASEGTFVFGFPSVVLGTMLTSRDHLILKRVFSLEPGVPRARKLDKPSGRAFLLTWLSG